MSAFGRNRSRDRSRGHGGPHSLDSRVPGLIADWNADLLVATSGALVTSWTDVTANAYALTAAGTARPTLTAAQFNGHAGIVFNGTANTMTVAAVPGTQPFTIYIVCKIGAVAANSIFYDNASSNAEVYCNATQTGMYANTVLAATPAPSGSPEVYAIVFNGASSLLERNNVGVLAGDAGASNGTGVTLGSQMGGAAAFSPTTYGRVLKANGAHALATRQAIVRSLGATYAVSVS